MTPDPFTDIVLYRSGDYRPPADPGPLYVNNWAELREQCSIALARRRDSYPKWIEAGRIAADLAARDISAWEELLGLWTWVAEGPDAEGAAVPPLLTLVDRIEAVDLALARIDQELARGNCSIDILLQSHLNQALRWHLERERRCERTIVDGIKLAAEIRADRANPERLAA